MSVDWTIVAAQMGNFLVLVWLLKRFLYQPILDGIDAREAQIAAGMREAALVQEQAAAAEADYRSQLAALQTEQAATIDRARLAADAERDALLAETRERMASEREGWDAHWQDEGRKYLAELHQAGAAALLALTRRALHDLADETFEQRIVAHIASRLSPMTAELRQSAGDAADALATTREPLPAAARERLTADLANIVPDVRLRFATDAAQSPGLVLSMGGAQLSWTVASYIDGLATLLNEQLAAARGAKASVDSD